MILRGRGENAWGTLRRSAPGAHCVVRHENGPVHAGQGRDIEELGRLSESVLNQLGLRVQTIGLVDDLIGDRLQSRGMRASMMRAEHELTARREDHLHVRLGAAAVAAVVRGESGSFKSRVHAPFLAPARPGCGGVGHGFAGGGTYPAALRDPVLYS
mgnify:CR=1 FL=1